MKILHAFREDIFGENRPALSCHAGTLALTQDGGVLAAWFGGTREKHPDVAIYCSKRSAGKWSAPVKVADEADIAHWNPVLFRANDGSIRLYYKVGHTIPAWHTRVMETLDDGLTWSGMRALVPGDAGGRGPVKNKPIYLSSGDILAPASLENDYWDAFCDISADNGRTWTMSQIVPILHDDGGRTARELESPHFCPGKGVIQPTLWEAAPGRVHMLLRSTGARIYRSDSQDYGRTWCAAYKTSLPNNNSGIDLVKLDDGKLFLCYNPVASPKGPRTPLVVGWSDDNGETWSDLITLEDGPAVPHAGMSGGFAYPSIIAENKTLHIIYTYNRAGMVYWQIDLSD